MIHVCSSFTTDHTHHAQSNAHRSTLQQINYITSFHFTPTAGRLLHVCTDTEDWGWGSLVAIRKLGLTPGRGEGPLIGKNEPSALVAVNQNYVLDVLLGVGVNDAGIHPFDSALESAGVYRLSICHIMLLCSSIFVNMISLVLLPHSLYLIFFLFLLLSHSLSPIFLIL